MAKNFPSHGDQITALKRVEGQVRGIQKMIEEKKYCVDILTQLHAIVGAIARVEDGILRRHIEGCVVNACSGKSEIEKQKKIDEVIRLLNKFRRS